MAREREPIEPQTYMRRDERGRSEDSDDATPAPAGEDHCQARLGAAITKYCSDHRRRRWGSSELRDPLSLF